jgi:hypothetical protein
VLNTTRQVGSVIGTAAVGALLQNRLLASLTSEATIKSAALPAAARGPFVNGFRQSAASGLLSGGPSGSAPGGAPGGSPALAAQLHRLGAEVFSTGYVLAMRWTMVMPIAVVLIAAASCLAIRNKAAGQDGAATAQDSQMAGTISSLGQSPGSSSGTGS